MHYSIILNYILSQLEEIDESRIPKRLVDIMSYKYIFYTKKITWDFTKGYFSTRCYSMETECKSYLFQCKTLSLLVQDII